MPIPSLQGSSGKPKYSTVQVMDPRSLPGLHMRCYFTEAQMASELPHYWKTSLLNGC